MKGRISVRLDERTIMLLSEISGMCSLSISSVVRYFINKEIDSVLDEKGYITVTPPYVKTERSHKQKTHPVRPVEFGKDWHMRSLICPPPEDRAGDLVRRKPDTETDNYASISNKKMNP
jgi:hypothetical protein